MSLSPRATRTPRASGFAKKPAVAKTNRLNDAARSRAEARSAPRAVPLDLAPLLSPYKGQGRLAVRIERMPQLARLSTGRNNGDNSWSLTLDQLEDLTYQPPEGMYEAHSLAIRIIGLDGGGSTLAVLDFPVPAGVAETEEDEDQTAEEPDSAQLPPLRAELAKLQASLVARESDLASARQKYAQAEAERLKIETVLAQGQAAWEAGQDERKFLSPSAGLLMRKGEAGPSTLNQAGDEIELRCLREELAGLQAVLGVRETALGEVRLAAQQAREAWRLESEAALSQAEATWKAGEAARLAAAEAQWQERSAAAFAEALAQAEAARDSVHEIQRRHLGDELEALKASLVDHKTALAQASSVLEQTRERGQLDLESTLSKAEKAWHAEEAARLAAAEAQWQEKSAKALAEARSQSEAALSKTERARIDDEAARFAAAEAQWQEEFAKAFAAARTQSETALSKAEKAWKADEAARLAAAEAQWQENSAKALAEARTYSEAALSKTEKARRADEAARLEAAEAQWQENSAKALAEARTQSEAALSKAKETWKADETARLEAAEAQWQEKSAKASAEARTQSEASLSKAKETWKTDEAARLAAAEAQWQQKSAKVLAEAQAQSEATLKKAHIDAETTRDSDNAIERRLREELIQAHSDLKQARERWQQESGSALLKAKETWKADEAMRFAAAEAQWQEKSAKTVAEATERFGEEALKQLRSKAESSRGQDSQIALNRLREELAATQAALAERENALAQTGLGLEQAREHWRQESEEALSKANKIWRADEAARFAEAEAQWHETSARTHAEATKRFEAAEAALKQLLIRTEQTRESGNAIEHRRLREELAMMQASLSDREAQLAEARLALEESFEPPAPESKIVLKPDRMGNLVERRVRERRDRQDEDAERPKSYLFRDLILVGALAAAVIVFYPSFQSSYPGYLPDIGTIFGSASAPVSVPAPEAPRAAEEFRAFVNSGDRLRPAEGSEGRHIGETWHLDPYPNGRRTRQDRNAGRLDIQFIPGRPSRRQCCLARRGAQIGANR